MVESAEHLYAGLLLAIIHVRLPRLSDVLRTGLREKSCLAVILEGRPVTADSSFIGYDGLEDAAVVVGVMPVLRREYNVSGLIANEVFVVGRNQQKLTFAEAACAIAVALPSIFRNVYEEDYFYHSSILRYDHEVVYQ
jgi:hypothetical protein